MALSKALHPNGVSRSRRVPRNEAGFRRASGYVAAIDFGTTFCSVAYTLEGSEDILKLPLDGPHTRVPNAILIEKESNTVAAFGYHAQEKFSSLKKQQQRFIYFERMKMILYRRQVRQFINSCGHGPGLFLDSMYSVPAGCFPRSILVVSVGGTE